MLTRSLITFIKKQAPNWTRDNIREIVDEVHKLCFSDTCGRLRVFDSTNGADPKLTTTSGTYEYTVDTDNDYSYDAWNITNVYESDEGNPADCIALPATQNSGAVIRFYSNPGTGTYYMRVYKKPTPISSESIQLEIPDGMIVTHFQEGVLALIEQSENGKSDRFQIFTNTKLKEIRNALNRSVYKTEGYEKPLKGY